MTVRIAGMLRSCRMLISGAISSGTLALSTRGLVSDGSSVLPFLILAGSVYCTVRSAYASSRKLTSSNRTKINRNAMSANAAAVAHGKKKGNFCKNAILPSQLSGYCSAGWERVAPTRGPMMMERSQPMDHKGYAQFSDSCVVISPSAARKTEACEV